MSPPWPSYGAIRKPSSSDARLPLLVVRVVRPTRSKRGAAVATAAVLSALIIWWTGYATEDKRPSASQERAAAWTQGPLVDGVRPTEGEDTAPHSPLGFSVSNEYTERGDSQPGRGYPWLDGVKLVEPYRNTTLIVQNPAGTASVWYRWTILAQSQPKVVTAEGYELVYRFTSVGGHTINLEELTDEGAVVRSMEETVTCKYVRREIRFLVEKEREELLDAMDVLWKVPSEAGRDRYGDGFVDVYDISRLHHAAAADPGCDHFHDGLGFLTSHAMLSAVFETSLQAVNPKLSLPYWDFTIEAHAVVADRGGDWGQLREVSPLFQESWFGGASLDDSQVKDGRWAFTEVPDAAVAEAGNGSLPGLPGNVYGQLRAPWNSNNRPYLTRGFGEMCGGQTLEAFPWPTCAVHYALETETETFGDWVWRALYDPHGTVHTWIGGVLDCSDTYDEIAGVAGEEAAAELKSLAFIHHKNLLRDGYYRCEGEASTEVSPREVAASGMCGCLDHDLSQGDDFMEIYQSMLGLPDALEGTTTDQKRDVTRLLCQGALSEGDHLQSSSPLDPTFWPVHPAVERLFLFRALTLPLDGQSWPDASSSSSDSRESEGSPLGGGGGGGSSGGQAEADGSSNGISLYGDDCAGHRGSDVFPFGVVDASALPGAGLSLWGQHVPAAANTLTNRQLLEALDPAADALPYVYDNFDWPHCLAEGYDFDDVLALGGGGGESAARALRR